jgi:hypothetical protein
MQVLESELKVICRRAHSWKGHNPEFLDSARRTYFSGIFVGYKELLKGQVFRIITELVY